MRTSTVTVREGENMGPVDWTHPTAENMPAIWREAEKHPAGFKFVCDNFEAPIFAICMYDGWPYWKPTPAIYHGHPLGHGEWSFFNSYGVGPRSIQPIPSQPTTGEPV